jgi:hypothetical protein
MEPTYDSTVCLFMPSLETFIRHQVGKADQSSDTLLLLT